MTHTDDYTRPDVAYEARDVCQTWTELSHQHEPEPQPQEQHHEEHHHEEHHHEEHHPHHHEEPPAPLPPVTEEPEIPPEPAAPVAAAAEEPQQAANLDTFTKDKLEDHQHQLNWEHGQIDYLGVDSFDNIMKQINAAITTPPPQQQPAPRRSASDGNVPTFKSPTSPASPTTRGKRRPASVIDSSDGSGEPVFEPELAPARVKPVEGAIGSIGVEHLLGADEPEAGTERKELVVRLPATRRQELISPAQLVAQEPGIDRLLARVSAGKPTVPRRAKVLAPVERVERVIKAAGKRQEIIPPEELASLTAPPVINGSRASRSEATNGTISKPTSVSSSTVQSRVEPVASKPPGSSLSQPLTTDGHSSKITAVETPGASKQSSADGVAIATALPAEPLRADMSIGREAGISQSAAASSAPPSAAQPPPTASAAHSSSATPPPASASVPPSAQPAAAVTQSAAAAPSTDAGRAGQGKAKKKSHRK